MKRFFLIPLVACFCCVNMWGATVQVGDYQALKNALDNASNGDVIELTADITIPESFYTTGHLMDITKSITLDGKNHTLTGYGKRGSNYTTLSINQNGSEFVDVVIKDLTIINPKTRVIETRGKISSLTINNCTLEAQATSGYQQSLTIGGDQSSTATVNLINSTLNAPKYYAVVTFNPVNMTAEGCTFNSWCSFYLKGQDSSAGSRGSNLTVNNCTLNNHNPNSGATNSFGAVVLEDDGITINVTNSTIDATCIDPVNAPQSGVCLSDLASRETEEVEVNIDATTLAQTTTTAETPVLDAGEEWVAAAETGKISIQHNVPAAKTNLTEGLRDNLYNGKMGTICVAKNVTGVSGATFYTVSYVELQSGQPYHLYFDEKEDNTTLGAGVPYVFIANSDKITGTFADEDPVSAGWKTAGHMEGNLNNAAKVLNNATDLDPVYVINNNRFYLMGDNVTIPVGRAFVNLSDVPTEDPTPATDPAFARRRICLTNGAPQSPTALENAAAEIKVEKVVRNGQVLIRRDGQFYDVTGRVIE